MIFNYKKNCDNHMILFIDGGRFNLCNEGSDTAGSIFGSV